MPGLANQHPYGRSCGRPTPQLLVPAGEAAKMLEPLIAGSFRPALVPEITVKGLDLCPRQRLQADVPEPRDQVDADDRRVPLECPWTDAATAAAEPELEILAGGQLAGLDVGSGGSVDLELIQSLDRGRLGGEPALQLQLAAGAWWQPCSPSRSRSTDRLRTLGSAVHRRSFCRSGSTGGRRFLASRPPFWQREQGFGSESAISTASRTFGKRCF